MTAVVLDDGGATPAATLDSLLTGTRKPDEILIVSHGAVTAVAGPELPGATSVRLRHLRMIGNDPATVRNFAIENTVTDALFFLRCSEVISPNFIADTVAMLDRHPQAGWVQPWARGQNHVASPVPPFLPYCLYNNCFVTPLGMFRLAALKETGAYTPGLNFHYLDWQLMLTLLQHGWVVLVTDSILACADLPDARQREQRDVGVGNIMYEQMVRANTGLFARYQHEVLVTTGSLMAMSGIYLNSRLSMFERKLLGWYRTARNGVESRLARIPLLGKLVNR